MQSENYFINTSARTRDGGYWEPHSSSIDFCETNYLLSSHVVEPHNVLSSLWGLSLLGLIGIYWGNPTGELRFKIAYAALILIGIGSAALHGTLHWVFQSSDELPMIYLVILVFYCCLENDTAPHDKSKYPWLPHILVLLAVVNTFVYFRFQQIYIVFLLTFASLAVAVLVLHVKIALRQRRAMLAPSTPVVGTSSSRLTTDVHRNNARVALRFYAWHYLVVGIATPVWVLDQLWCTKLLPFYDALPTFLRGCTLHVVWHAMSGFGGHTILQFLVACRMSVLGRPCRIRWILGAIPVVASADGHKDGTKQA
jgi:dihydroceramidase